MPIRQVQGTDRRYYLIAYDKDGVERRDDPDGVMSDVAANAVQGGGVTDVFLVSHGWKGDVPAAIEQYDRWIGTMIRATDDIARVRAKRPGYGALIVGLHWPSQPWGDEEIAAPAGAAFGAATSDIGAEWDSARRPPTVEELVDQYADRIADTPEARAALRTIFEAAQQNATPPTLPPEVVAAYDQLNAASGMGSDGVGGAPGSDREPFDAQRAYRAARPAIAGAFGTSGWGGLLAPLRQLSFWKMKDRGRNFGETGGFRLLGLLQDRAGAGVRFHLIGHSFGCVVVSGVLAGPAGAGSARPPVHSATLIQGALSLWAYTAKIDATGGPGYFHSVVRDGRVAGPIVTTQSRFDRAVGFWYPKAAGVAGQVAFTLGFGELPKYGGVGTFGIQGPSTDAAAMDMLPVNQPYGFAAGRIYNVNGDSYIRNGDALSGAHSDIAHPEVAHAVWEAVLTDAPR
jgi:hypothetical protein